MTTICSRLALAVLLAAAPLFAQVAVDDHTKHAAREIANDGVAAYDARDYQQALELFQRAYAIVPAPTISIFEARCLAELGLLIEATERYEATRRTALEPDAPPQYRTAIDEAARELESVRVRIPRLRIQVHDAPRGGALQVKLDGKLVRRELVGVPIPVNPGQHLIEASAPGRAPGAAAVTAEEKRLHVVEVRLGPAAVSAPSADDGARRRKTFGFVSLGVGAAGVAVGAIGAIVARDKQDGLDEQCPERRCPTSAESDVGAYRTARTASLIGYGVGVAGLAGGALLLLWPEGEQRSGRRVRPVILPGMVGASGRF